MDKLKPCPFCHSTNLELYCDEQALPERRYMIVCNGCMAHGPEVEDEELAIESWNVRLE